MIGEPQSQAAAVVFRALICGALLLVSACRGQNPPGTTPVETAPANEQYEPLYRSRAGESRESAGTLRGDFQRAASASTLEEAATRWQTFLEKHNPPGAEFEDGAHASYVTAAQYELLRVYYLLGRRSDGDALLRRLDPPGWEK